MRLGTAISDASQSANEFFDAILTDAELNDEAEIAQLLSTGA